MRGVEETVGRVRVRECSTVLILDAVHADSHQNKNEWKPYRTY